MKTNKMAAIFSNQHEYNELRPLTDERSLSALYFAGKYRIMDFALSSIVNAGINNVYTLISQEKVRSYLDHLGGGKEWGLDTIGSYAYLDFYQKLLQSQANGGEYFNDLITFLATANAPYTVFLENKIVANVDLQSVLHFHQENGNRITAVFKRVSKKNVAPDDQLYILDEENTIMSCQQAIDTQSQDSYNLGLNIYVADTKWLIAELKKAQKCGAPIDIGQRFASLAAKYRTNAYEYTGYLHNVHDIKSYYDSNIEMLDKKNRDSLLHGNQRIITRIRNEVGTYYTTSSKVKNSLFATGCRINGTVENSILSRRIDVAEDSNVKNTIVMASCTLEAGSSVEYAILDKNVVIKKDVVVKGTPDNPVVIKKGDIITKDLIVE
ncbi:glucose-1-phosphate adenylyltransferase subunit GlgD [Lactobacillus acidophilus]